MVVRRWLAAILAATGCLSCADSDGVTKLDAAVRRDGGSADATPLADTAAPGCAPAMASCAASSDCCGGLSCVAGTCGTTPVCEGGACASDADCCPDHVCSMGACAVASASCAGASCTNDADCCPGAACLAGRCFDDGSGGIACRGSCPAGYYCEYSPNDCGRGAEGVCLPRPTVCPDLFAPVCSCTGMTLGNACEAAAAGVDVEYSVACGDFDGGTPPAQ